MQTPQVTHENVGWFSHLQFWLAGVDAEVLQDCPKRDIGNVKTVAWLLMAVWIWQSVLFALVGHMMLAKPGEIRPFVALCGVGLATIILLMDSYVIVRASWFAQGVKELERGGLKIPGMFGTKVKNACFLMVRLFLSLVIAQLVAIFFSVLMLEKDITADIQGRHLDSNRALHDRITAQMDETIAKVRREHEDLRVQLAKATDDEGLFRRTTVDPGMDDAEVKLAIERVARLTQSKSEAEAELASAQRFASDELAGVKRKEGNSGRAGYGPVRRAAEERVANAQNKLAAVTRELVEADAKLAQLREKVAGASGERKGAAEAKLGEVGSARKELLERYNKAEENFRYYTEKREEIIRRAVEADPAFAPLNDGFIARLQALHRLTENRHILVIVVLFDAALFLIELAAVLAKTSTFVPATYATYIAEEEFRRWYAAARRTAEATGATAHRHEEEAIAHAEDIPVPPPERPFAGDEEAELPAPADDVATAKVEPLPEDLPAEEQPPRKRGRPPGPRFKPQLQPLAASDSQPMSNGIAAEYEGKASKQNVEEAVS